MTDKIEFKIELIDYQASGCKTLLEYLEKADLLVHYHCRDGFCGACRTKLIAGNVDYQKDPLAFVRKGDFLPCCSQATSDITVLAETKKGN